MSRGSRFGASWICERRMSWRIELSPSAARRFRELPREVQRRLSERIEHLASAGPPPTREEGDTDDVIPVPAGEQILLCVTRPGPVLLIAEIESLDESLSGVAGRLARPALERALGGAGGDRDDVIWLRAPSGRLPAVHRRPKGLGLMDLMIELRRAVRALRRQPGISLLAIAALAFGIGLPTAIFSMLDASFLRGLPIEDGRDVMHLERRPIGASGEGWGAFAHDYAAWRDGQRSFEVLGAFTATTATLRSESGADRWSAARMTPEAFEVLGEGAVLGRAIRSDDVRSGAAPVVVLGYALWRDRLASDPAAVGQTVWVDGVPHTVIGVMSPAFRFPNDADIWLPLTLSATGAPASGDPTYQVMGRLRDGVSADEAHAEFALIAGRLAERYPETHAGYGIAVKPITERFMGETPVRTMYVMLGAVLLVLVIACANVANLLLVRAVHRVRDLAVRAALGARRGRLMLQLMMEAGVLALVGGLAGTAVAAAGVRGLGYLLGDRMPYWADLRLDGSTLLFALLLSFGAALLAGLLPALKATTRDLAGTLYDESRGSTGMRIGRIMHGLVVLEITLSLGLLVSTGLLLRSVLSVQSVPLGFTTGNVLSATVTLPDSYDAEARAVFFERFRTALDADPRVGVAALANGLPATRLPVTRFALEGMDDVEDANQLPLARSAAVSIGFFEVFDVTPLQGRVFGPGDTRAGLPVAIVSRRFVEQYLGGGDALGRRIRMGRTEDDVTWRTIVGVVPDLWLAAFDAPSGDRNPAGIFVPLTQSAPTTVSVAVRTRGEPAAVADALRAAAFGLDPDVPIYQVRTMEQLLADNNWFYGLGAAIMGACGLAALLLASIGLYGVVAFSVGRRTREIGIRMAMGARRPDVVKLVLRRGLLQIAVGVVLGIALAVALGRGIASLLFEVSPTDPLIYGATAALLATIGIGAMLVPALRAARIQPVSALRAE